MKIEELFRQLSFGELSNLSISADGNGTIKPEKHETIILHAQTALNALYGKFLLSEKSLVLVPNRPSNRYPLLAIYSMYGRPSVDPDVEPFIIDTEEDPFTEDVLKVLSVVDHCNKPIYLNDETADVTIYTPSPGVIQFPRFMNPRRPITSILLTYQAKHPKLDPTDTDQEIWLPDELYPALRSYIASLVYSHMNGAENTNKGIEFMAKYDLAVAEVIDRDLVTQTGYAGVSRFRKNGFV